MITKLLSKLIIWSKLVLQGMHDSAMDDKFSSPSIEKCEIVGGGRGAETTEDKFKHQISFLPCTKTNFPMYLLGIFSGGWGWLNGQGHNRQNHNVILWLKNILCTNHINKGQIMNSTEYIYIYLRTSFCRQPICHGNFYYFVLHSQNEPSKL